mmetsp:Transcript_16686/g.13684  ORF Transcript_16686/g.13684 Transcript_16686/m.13684 type:complete len:166 (+) Transcript_16686:67-564(+)
MEVLKDRYVSIYLAFNEVRRWKDQDDVALLLPLTSQGVLSAALKDSLEGVGNALQKTVERMGGEWKTCRAGVVGAVKQAGAAPILLAREERVRLASASLMHTGEMSVEVQSARKAHGLVILTRGQELMRATLLDMVELGAAPALLPTAHSMLESALSQLTILLQK